jgi:hypothetical protein
MCATPKNCHNLAFAYAITGNQTNTNTLIRKEKAADNLCASVSGLDSKTRFESCHPIREPTPVGIWEAG